MANNTIKISVRGKWLTVPALEVDGKTVIVKGNWIKVASIQHEEWLETELQHPEDCIKALQEQSSPGPHPDIFTFAQKPPATHPKYSYPFEWESVAAVRTTSFKQWWDQLPQETRKNVRRSQKRGVVVKVVELDDDLIKGLVELNNDSPVRQGRRNIHYGKSAEQVREDQSSFSGRSSFIGAYLENELIGYMKIVYRGEVASILHILPKASHQDKRPANALLAKGVELCEANGASYLVFGKFNYGNKRDNPLREFKVRNGFGEVLVPRFYVPLTRWGKLCLKARLHRGLIGILPHNVITLGVNARAKWYNFLYSLSRCSSRSERPNRTRQMER